MAKYGCIRDVYRIVVVGCSYVGLYDVGASRRKVGFRVVIRDFGGAVAVYVRFMPWRFKKC